MKRKMIIAAFLIVGVAVTIFFVKRDADEKKLPGKNLDLYAVLDLFHNSSSLQDFERSLNSKDKKINNLDLNNDGKVDYIRVIDNASGKDHAITLRAPLSATESQDVAVIEIEKSADKEAHVQIVGDEDLYGKDYIIEPMSNGSTQTSAGFFFSTDVVVNVWYWPCISFIYAPDYVVWVSPWYWDYYPTWWFAWEPMDYDVYYPVVYVYHDHWNRVYEHRIPECDRVYAHYRVHSDLDRMMAHNRTKENKPVEGNVLKKNVVMGAKASDKIKPDNLKPAKAAGGNKTVFTKTKSQPVNGKIKTDNYSTSSSAGKNKVNNTGGAKKSGSIMNEPMPLPGSDPKTKRNVPAENSIPKTAVPKEGPVSPKGGVPKTTFSTSARSATSPHATIARKGQK